MREVILLYIFDIIFIPRIRIEKKEFFQIGPIVLYIQENITYPLDPNTANLIMDRNCSRLVPKILLAVITFFIMLDSNQSLKALIVYYEIMIEKVKMVFQFWVVSYYHSPIIFL